MKASLFLRDVYNTVAEIEKEVSRLRHHENFAAHLYVLPLRDPEQKEVIALMDYRESMAKLKATIDEDMEAVLQKMDESIKTKMHGTPPKRTRKQTTTRRK